MHTASAHFRMEDYIEAKVKSYYIKNAIIE